MIYLFHIPTMLLCLGASTAIIGGFLSFAWLADRQDLALKYWSIGYWSLSIGAVLISLSSAFPEWLSLGLGNLLIFVCLVFYMAGFQAFDGKPVSVFAAALAPLIWAGLYAFWPYFQDDKLTRVIVGSALIAFQAVLVARIAWSGRVSSGQQSVRAAVAIAFGVIASVYAVRVPAVVMLSDNGAPGVSIWPGLFMFLAFVQLMFSGFAIFVLVRGRAELRYRIASEVDELTGLLNRRAFISYVSAARASGAGGGALALLDIDHFKRINDRYGHGAGDEALRVFAEVVAGNLSASMIFGRIGGEEFGIYFAGMGVEEAKIHCEKIRVEVERCGIRLASEELHITVSQGLCADVVGNAEVTFLLGLADRALYISKRGGRNRVSTLNPSAGLKMIASKMAGKTIKTARTTHPARQPS